MGRKRKQGSEWMPERVYIGKSAYEFKPFAGKTIRLCALNATKRLVWQRYEEEKKIVESIAGSFSELVREFLESKGFIDLAPRTQKDYLEYSNRVLPVFGKITADKMLPKHIRTYMDKRGNASEVQANREHSFMSKVFAWGYERGKVNLNPCLKVKKFTETPRKRYLTDDEYNAVLQYANPLLRELWR
jgi:integrase